MTTIARASSPSARAVRLLALLAVGTLAGAPALAQGWSQGQSSTTLFARSRSAMAYDIQREVTVLFGGSSGSSLLGDTWEYNGTWTVRNVAVQPAARSGHGMAYDRRRGVTVLFGGFDGFSYLGDTWEWNGVTWTQRTLPLSPSPRSSGGLAYDASRGVCVLFGGATSSSTVQADTWEYDGSAWVQRATTAAPSPRRGAALTWDEARRETLLFGGSNATGSQHLADTWTWSGAAWTQKTASGPSARRDAAIAFDGNCGRAVMFGGSSGSALGDAWAWNGIFWAPVTAPGTSSSAPVMAHHAQRRTFVMLSGATGISLSATVWLLSSCGRWMATVEPAVVGRTARYRYDYPGAAANLNFCWTLVTTRLPAELPAPIPGFPSIGRCRVDLLNQLAAPATLLDASGALTTALAIPNNPAFCGFEFDVQSLDLDLFTNTLRWADNDVQATVGPTALPTAAFTATPTSGNAPLVVQFTDTSTQFPTSWQWDFDNDGVIDSTQQNPSWTYPSNGVYSVRLVATNLFGSGTVTQNNQVVVGSLPPNPLLQMAPIAPGTFQMGSTAFQAQYPNEAPVRQVTLTQPFWMGKYEVTQAQYQSVMGSNPSYFQGANAPNAPQRPVEQVSWSSAVAYCQALTATEQAAGRVPAGYQYRLPTEAEWEYCCRASTTTEWNTGTSLSTSQANFGGVLANGTYPNSQTAVVGSYAPNAFGLHDMHGNVWEWCLDSFATYAPGPVTDPFVTGGASRVIRGGSWYIFSTAAFCRSAYRYYDFPGVSLAGLGFRVVLAPVLVP